MEGQVATQMRGQSTSEPNMGPNPYRKPWGPDMDQDSYGQQFEMSKIVTILPRMAIAQ